MSELQLDLDVVEANAEAIAKTIRRLNKHWRPHVKAHRQPKLAHLLIDRGAVGVTAANVVEVETMAGAGLPSIVLAHLVVAPNLLDRLARVTRQCELFLTIDHFVHAERISEAARRNAVTFRVLIDIDIGMGRTGCRPRIDATQLAIAADRLEGVSVVGIMGYEGHLLQISDEEEKRCQIFEAMNMLAQSRDNMRQRGLRCDIVSAGGSGSFWITGQHAAVTELQAGGGIFGDPFYIKNCGLKNVVPALTVPADVVSRPSLSTAVVNSGRKAINPFVCEPSLLDVPGGSIDAMSAEHTVISLSGDARDLKIGDSVRFAVGYSDHTILMHDRICVCRSGEKIDEWPVIR